MREIKFRAWDELNKEMIHMINFPFYRCKIGNESISIDDYAEQHVINIMKWMQFTGLKDKNGTEIYEGDIVRCWVSAINFESKEWYSPLPVIYCNLWCQFVLDDKPNKEQYGIWEKFDQYEVIGNIYETPQLL